MSLLRLPGMSDGLKALSAGIAAQRKKQSERLGRASLFVKVVLVSGFSAITAVAQFVAFPDTGPTAAQVVGIVSALVVAIGGAFVIITEQDATAQLALAQSAIEAARDAEAKYEIIDDLAADADRLIELYQAMSVMRGAIERLGASPSSDEEDAAAKVLRASERSLAIALGFAQADQWTLSIYRAVPCEKEVNRALLKCIAHKRAIECAPSEARVWKEGTGIMGVAYSNGDEIIVPDLQAEGMRAVFGTSANEMRPYDDDRYRSMVAVPILVQGLDKPWGVVSATSDRAEHFSYNDGPGVRTDEGVRALAGMIALAVAVVRKNADSAR